MNFNRTVGGPATPGNMFSAITGWTVKFNCDGVSVGGALEGLENDQRITWHMDAIGGVLGKRILELGPLEGHHTRSMIESGAREVVAIEGISDCFLRCLIVKEAFHLDRALFLFGDFCQYASETAEAFDAVLAAGVLYHQTNPAKLIHDLARITDAVMVWSHVAGESHPGGTEGSVTCGGMTYHGKLNDYGGTRPTLEGYCGGLQDTSFWLYPADMLKCFQDAGFARITEKESPSNDNGDSLLFVARK